MLTFSNILSQGRSEGVIGHRIIRQMTHCRVSTNNIQMQFVQLLHLSEQRQEKPSLCSERMFKEKRFQFRLKVLRYV